jgi:hypothetical protein
VEREVLDLLEDENKYSADAVSMIWGNGAEANNAKGVLSVGVPPANTGVVRYKTTPLLREH